MLPSGYEQKSNEVQNTFCLPRAVPDSLTKDC